MEIHQVIVGASVGDAITDLALRYRDVLREHVVSEVYALHVEPEAETLVKRLPEYPRTESAKRGDNLLVFHASIGEPRVIDFLLVLVYHNISPASDYARYAPAFARLLARGRTELEALRDRVVLTIADSEFNARELEQLGYAGVRVVPPVANVSHLRATEPDPGLAHHLKVATDGPSAVFVGQLLPHKRIEALLSAYYVLSTYVVPNCNLYVIGPRRIPAYAQTLGDLGRSLRLTKCAQPGRVSIEELAAFYEHADAFVTLSRHEGFCLPLVEAMAFGVPIVALDDSAVPETVGDAGLLLPRDASVELVAEAVASVIEDSSVRSTLVERGRKRLELFEPDRVRRRFAEEVLAVA
jgi:glycosyltransferase involved in cell wall biosynthesis